jgi:hypothetical protein
VDVGGVPNRFSDSIPRFVRVPHSLVKLPMTIGKGKRPRDPNQLAKWIVDHSTEDKPDEFIIPTKAVAPVDLSSYMAAIGRKGGQIGGKRRLKTMTQEQRRKVAAKAARARWKKR